MQRKSIFTAAPQNIKPMTILGLLWLSLFSGIFILTQCQSPPDIIESANTRPNHDFNWEDYVSNNKETEIGYEVHKMVHCMGINPDKGKNKYKLFQVKNEAAWQTILQKGYLTSATYTDAQGSLGVGVHYWNPISKKVLVLKFKTDRGLTLESVEQTRIPNQYKINNQQIFMIHASSNYPTELFRCN